MKRVLFVSLSLVAAQIATAQISVLSVRYQTFARATSGSSSQTVNSGFVNLLSPAPTFFHRVDAFAQSLPSDVNSWASVLYNQNTQNDLSTTLEACWTSQDFGAPNSCDVRSFLRVEFFVASPMIMSVAFAGVPPEVQYLDAYTGGAFVPNSSSYTPFLNSITNPTDTRLWAPGYYRYQAQRQFILQGNSLGCVPMGAVMRGTVPEPGSFVILAAGASLLLRRKRAQP